MGFILRTPSFILHLLAAFDLIAKGQAEAGRIPWSQALRDRVSLYFEVARRNDDQKAPDLPFYHLKGDRFWEPHGDFPTRRHTRRAKQRFAPKSIPKVRCRTGD